MESQVFQRGQRHVIADGLVQDDGFVVPVLGSVGHGMADGGGNIVDLGAVRKRDGTGTVPGSAENGLAHLVHAALGQASEAQNLALVQFKAHILDFARHGHVFHRQHHFIGYRRAVIGAVIGGADLPAHHQALQIVLGHVRGVYGVDVFAVPQHGNGVRVGEHLAQIVADKDDGAPVRPGGVHDLVQLQPSVLGERRGGFVDH